MDANYTPYKRYDDEFKRKAIELVEGNGTDRIVRIQQSATTEHGKPENVPIFRQY